MSRVIDPTGVPAPGWSSGGLNRNLKAALRDERIEDPTFRRLSYEIAFSEYSMGLGYEMRVKDPLIPAEDLLYEVRSTLNRVALAAAALYR